MIPRMMRQAYVPCVPQTTWRKFVKGAVQKDAKAEKKNNNNKNNGETLYIGWWIIKTATWSGLDLITSE